MRAERPAPWWFLGVCCRLLWLMVLRSPMPAECNSDVCTADDCGPRRYLFCSFNYRNGLGDQRLLWFQTALKLSKRLGRTLVLPPFWVPDVDGDQYQERNAHFEPFHSLYDPAAFGDYASWISYTDFRTQANATIDVVYMTPREAKNHHGIDCFAGQTVEMPDGRMSIFEDAWWYSRIKCLETREMMTPFLQSREEVLALNTRNNQELPGYRVDLIPLGECGKQWPYDMAFNTTLVDAARSFIRERLMHDGSFMAVHWRHGTSMHKDAEKLADEVLSTLDKHGLIVRRAFLSTNCKDEADLEELKKKLGMEIVQFKEASFAPWQRALIDMIIASEAPLFVPSSYSSSFAKTILFHRVKGRQKIEEDVRVHC
ncbi:unnamed protein product [Symbiodinium sp. KB8]|nr:unnamed protein product [Symbiodinium sp. KB8]